jgi:hypothetical protein
MYIRKFDTQSYTPVFKGPAVGFNASPGLITSPGDQPQTGVQKANKRKQWENIRQYLKKLGNHRETT